MGVLKRSKDIVNSNINAALDKVEDPSRMVRYMVREMEESLTELKSSCAARMADRATLRKSLEQAEEKVSRWSGRAVLAVQEKKDDLAREALVEKKKAEAEIELLENELGHLEQIIEESAASTAALEEKLEEAVQKQYMLIQRGIHAKEKVMVSRSLKQAGSSDTVYRFNELEKRIERMEAEADLTTPSAGSSREKDFRDMEQDRMVEEELQALKKEKKSSPAGKGSPEGAKKS